MSRNVSGSILSLAKGLNLTYYGLDKQITIQLILWYNDGTSFGYFWKTESGNKWACLEALFEDFVRLKRDASSDSAGQRLDVNRVEKLEVICQLDEQDFPGT